MIRTAKWKIWLPDSMEWEFDPGLQDLVDEKDDEMEVRFLVADQLGLDVTRVDAERDDRGTQKTASRS